MQALFRRVSPLKKRFGSNSIPVGRKAAKERVVDILIFGISFWIAACIGCVFLMAHWFGSKFFFPRVGRYWLGIGIATMFTAVAWDFPEIKSKMPTVLPVTALLLLLLSGGACLGHAIEKEEKWQQRENEKLANRD